MDYDDDGPPQDDIAVDTNADYKLAGGSACDVYEQLRGRRSQVEALGRKMSEITIPSVYPPHGYRGGDDIPGNNQSVNAYCVSTLASHLMFMAFPPNQPIFRLEAIEYEVQAQISADPTLWAKMQVALSRLEEAHRKRFETTTISSTYKQYIDLLLVAGNALWKHMTLEEPECYSPSHYVVKRNSAGKPLLTIHRETVAVATLPKDVQEFLMQGNQKLAAQKQEWLRECDLYSVCKLKVTGDGKKAKDKSWLFWQEDDKGQMIPDTQVETDFEYPPMWPGWLIPVHGSDWGRSYCDLYRGDLFSMEALASAGNDGAAISALSLLFVKPGSPTNIKKVRSAKNLEVLSGNAQDVSFLRAEKGADLAVASTREQDIAKRLFRAFLVMSSIQRNGERVTKEEIVRLAGDLDRATGGLYTEVAQTSQRQIIMRAIRLNEDENPKLPILPSGVVSVQVTTGVDAMGQSQEETALEEFAEFMSKVFPQTVQADIDGKNFAYRLAATKGIKPDGLILTDQQSQAKQETMQKMQGAQTLIEKGSGPVAAELAKRLPAPGQQPPQQQPAPQQGA